MLCQTHPAPSARAWRPTLPSKRNSASNPLRGARDARRQAPGEPKQPREASPICARRPAPGDCGSRKLGVFEEAPMKLGLAIEYAGRGVEVPIERIKRCEALGYDSVWTAEAYGSDAITPLAYIAAHTRRIRLGTGVMQLAARSPAMAAMQLGTLDALAGGGRVIGGLGVSGPPIVGGWDGAPWGRPLQRMRDHLAVPRQIFPREAPVSHDGAEIQLPYRGPGASGLGKPLKSILHFEPRPRIWLGTG